MLRGEGNDDSEKTTIGLISKKTTFARGEHFFCTFLCRCFARLQRKTPRNVLVTQNRGNVVCVLVTFSLSFAGLSPTFSFSIFHI